MAYREWRKWYDARQVVNADEFVREHLQNGTYEGTQPIANEDEWNGMLEQAKETLEEFSEVPDMVETEQRPWWKIW